MDLKKKIFNREKSKFDYTDELIFYYPVSFVEILRWCKKRLRNFVAHSRGVF